MLRQTLSAFLVMILAMRSVAFADTTRTIHLRTTDDVAITGSYYPVAQTAAPSALLIHSVSRNRAIWDEFARLLQQNGIAALAIDLRGHGDSTRKMTADGPVALDFRTFAGADYQDAQLDIEAAIDWLEAQPELDKTHIALIGESLGANIALRYAAINSDLAAVVLFSPGVNYRGVRTDDAIPQLGHMPLRIFVSQHDPVAFESCRFLTALRQDAGVASATNDLTICTGNLHGADMLLHVRGLPQIVVIWLKHVFAPAPTTAAAPATNAPPPVTAPSAK